MSEIKNNSSEGESLYSMSSSISPIESMSEEMSERLRKNIAKVLEESKTMNVSSNDQRRPRREI